MTDEQPSGPPEGVEGAADPGVDSMADHGAGSTPAPVEAAATDGAGVTETAWVEGLNGDNAAFAAGKGWDSPNAVIDSYRNLESLFGHDRAGRTLVLPQEEEDAAAYDAFYDRLGRPDAPDDYSFEEAPDAAVDGALTEWFRDTAYDAGLTECQASSLFDAWNRMASARIDAAQQAHRTEQEESEQTLREKWGGAYDRKIGHARRAARAFGGEHLDALESAMGLASVSEFLARIGEAIGEDALPVGRGGEKFGLSPEDARANYEQRKGDAEFVAALQDTGHPGHAAARAERARYIDAIWPQR